MKPFLVLLASLLPLAALHAAEPPPNIILVMPDDVGYGSPRTQPSSLQTQKLLSSVSSEIAVVCEFKSSTCEIKLTPIRSPNLQAHVERVIQTIKHEVLNAFCIVSDKHLNHLLQVTQDWYNHRRDHTAREQLPPIRESDSPPMIDLSKHKLICVEELGGHLKSYRAAA